MTKPIKDMTDAELITIINETDYLAGIHPVTMEARIELHSRQKKIDSSINRRTLWILIFTIIAVILALILLLFEYIIPIPESHEPSLTMPYRKSQGTNNDMYNQNTQNQNKPHMDLR